MKRQAGNSIIEYALPLGVFMVSGIAIIIATDVPDAFAEFFSGTMHGDNNGASVEVKALGSASPPPGIAAAAASVPAPTANTDTVCFQSNLCVTVPVINDPAEAGTETAGSLGGDETVALANVLTQIAEQLEDAGIDPQFVSMVTNLANEGHDLGASIDNLSAACPGGNCGNSMANVTPILNNIDGEEAQFDTTFLQVQQWLQANPGALDAFPEARYIIEMEAAHIAALADGINASQSNQQVPDGTTGGTTCPNPDPFSGGDDDAGSGF